MVALPGNVLYLVELGGGRLRWDRFDSLFLCAASVLLPVLLLLLVQVSESTNTLAHDSAAIDELVSWLEEGGAELSAVKVGSGVGGERGVRAARDFAPGDTILRGNSACYLLHAHESFHPCATVYQIADRCVDAASSLAVTGSGGRSARQQGH